MKTFALIAVAILGLAACENQPAPKNVAAAPAGASAQKPATTLAAEAADRRFGAGFFTHDTVEDATATGTAVCGYVSPTKDPAAGAVFVFADGKFVTEKDAKADDFRSLVEHKCPDFVLHPYIPPVALSAEAA